MLQTNVRGTHTYTHMWSSPAVDASLAFIAARESGQMRLRSLIGTAAQVRQRGGFNVHRSQQQQQQQHGSETSVDRVQR